MNEHTQHASMTDSHATLAGDPWVRRAVIGTALATGAVVLSPYILPIVGIGETALAEEAMIAMHGTGLGNGLAGAINGVINSVPLVGPTLAHGGLITAATSATIGIGGLLLGKYIDRHDDGTHSIRWGKVLATAALATSALIAMPSLLTSISVGLVYLAAVSSGVELASYTVAAMAETLGSVGSLSAGMTGLAGAAAALPHMLTCMAPAIPGVISLGMLGSDDSPYMNNLPPQHDGDTAISRDGTISLRMEYDGPIRAHVPCKLKLHITHNDTGAPVTADELTEVHGMIIHLFMADESLRDYHHIHPLPTDQPGVYEVSFTPQTSYHYNTWSDIELKRDGVEHRIHNSLDGAVLRSAPAYVVPSSTASRDGITAHWRAHPPLQKGVASTVDVTFTDNSGKPLTDLEPVVGAFIHLVGISKDGSHMIHPHPMEETHAGPGDHGGPGFSFHITPETSGAMQFYLQVQRGGVESFLPLGQMIKAPARSLSENVRMRQQDAGMQPGLAGL